MSYYAGSASERVDEMFERPGARGASYEDEAAEEAEEEAPERWRAKVAATPAVWQKSNTHTNTPAGHNKSLDVQECTIRVQLYRHGIHSYTCVEAEASRFTLSAHIPRCLLNPPVVVVVVVVCPLLSRTAYVSA